MGNCKSVPPTETKQFSSDAITCKLKIVHEIIETIDSDEDVLDQNKNRYAQVNSE